MDRMEPIRDDRLSPNSVRICISRRPSSKSRSFCRYETAPHLFIPQALEPACLQRFARFSALTPVVSAHAKSGGEGPARRSLGVGGRYLGLGAEFRILHVDIRPQKQKSPLGLSRHPPLPLNSRLSTVNSQPRRSTTNQFRPQPSPNSRP